ncbi:MAG: hypothetical protein K8L97_33625, partial [Anaerolineae bacterium]|nr:hypothetical protein [Anaerolineae bacterium]
MSDNGNSNLERDVVIGAALGAVAGLIKAVFEGKKGDEVVASTFGGAAAGGVTGGIKNAIDQAEKQN